MTIPARIMAACVLVIGLAAGNWAYLLWPRWFGAEVLLPVKLQTRSGQSGGVFTDYPDARLQLDADNALKDRARTDATFTPVRSIGVVWDSRVGPKENAQILRRRTLFLQVRPSGKTLTSGDALSRVVSVSRTRVPDVMNLAVVVDGITLAAQADVHIAGGRVPVPQDLAIDQAVAILKVLPSGRHAIVGMIVGGKRVVF